MNDVLRHVRLRTGAFLAALTACLCAGGATRTDAIRAKLLSGDRDYVFVAMHRGDWRDFPENSKGAILSSIETGADIVELDAHMTKDGRFILNHDNTVDRTTTGKGKVEDLTLAEIKALKLLDRHGRPTDYDVLTLEEALELARGKILVNIDKFGAHPREILDAVKAVGATREVLVKSPHAPAEARRIFGEEHWKDVERGELLYMPVILFCWSGHERAARILPLWLAEEPRLAEMYEVCADKPEYLSAFDAVARARGRPRLWINTLWDSLNAGHGDERALADPDAHWGWALDQGATMLQTDYGRELIDYLARKGRRSLDAPPKAPDVVPLLMPQPRQVVPGDGIASLDAPVQVRHDPFSDVPENLRDQAYRLVLAPEGVTLFSAGSAGARYGRATLDQLRRLAAGACIPACTITDWPALRWRGFMTDCGRNYQSLPSLRATLDLMAAYKLNLFHWHLTDYHGWRLESRKYPQLNRADAMTRHPGRFYTQREFVETVRLAAARGITVMPELDVPGHTEAFRRGMKIDKMNSPGVDEVVCALIDELCALVPKEEMPFIHIGTDEVWEDAEKVPDEWYRLWADRVAKNGRTVVGWWPGHPLEAEGDVAAMVWGQRGEATDTPHAYFDSTQNYYLNHMEPEEILRGAAYQLPCRWGTSRALGALVSVWHDDITVGEEDVWRHVAVAPGVVMFGESFWRADAANRPDLWAHAPEASDRDIRRQEELERRVLEQRDRVLGPNHPIPFPYVAQTAMRWRVTDAETGKVLAREMAGATITPRHWRFRSPENDNLLAATTGCFVAETWIKSENRIECGAWIGFTGFSRSSGRMSDARLPAIGEWSRHGAKAELNGQEIPPPEWGNPGAKCTRETPFTNEEFYFREPTPICLEKGWNHVRLTVPKADARGRWTATFAPLLGTSEHPRDVPGLAYSARPPEDEEAK